jgi:hypothetical protein
MVAPGAGFRFAVIGDYGSDSEGEGAVAKLVSSWRPDFVLTTGDNNYPLGMALTIDKNIGRHYANFIGNYQGRYGPGPADNRFWPSPGNHDWYAPDGLNPYLDYFVLPGNERYYDVDLGLVHLFSLDSDSREPDGITAQGKQAQWLKERLQASTACYKIVYFHHAAYSSGAHGSQLEMRWPFSRWGADAVLAGHDHHYERLQVEGIPYFVNGLGGASPYPLPGKALAQSAVRFNSVYGAQRVIATVEDITFEFRTVEDKEVDRYVAKKDCLSGTRKDAGVSPADASWALDAQP